MSEPHSARQTVPVTLEASQSSRQYDIVIQSGLLARLGEECERILPLGAKILLLTDAKVAGLYLSTAKESLEAAGFHVIPHVIPAGEASKSLGQAQAVYETALQANLSRKDAIVGLGGGVVGDLAGFCASSWHRGMPVVQIPTTLVAQVDSAIGGKTAVNLGQVKNAVGTFHQPLAVLVDPAVLASLPERQFAAGLAEVIKYGMIETACTGETGFFDWLETHATNLWAVLPEMIRRCCHIKAAVVMQDETETRGLRFYLNLGHTFGHAYESLSQYGLLHGEAVAIGLHKAARLSCRLGRFEPSDLKRLEGLLRQCGLWANMAQSLCFSPQVLLSRMHQDKKNLDAQLRLILPEGAPGHVVSREDVPEAEILSVMGQIRDQ